MHRMRRHAGFTLIELMVVLAISAILVVLAVPSFVTFTRKTNISNGVNTFMADARFARSEAVRLGGSVVMCRSDAPEVTNPSCGTGSGPDGNGWVSGWIIFQDLNNNGTKDAADPILRIQGPLTSLNSIADSSGSTKLVFTATGRLKSLSSGVLTLQFGSAPDFPNDVQRMVCVSLGGRVRIAGDGNASCS
jgi:type IV fimbrial biogenesis protein FimT